MKTLKPPLHPAAQLKVRFPWLSFFFDKLISETCFPSLNLKLLRSKKFVFPPSSLRFPLPYDTKGSLVIGGVPQARLLLETLLPG